MALNLEQLVKEAYTAIQTGKNEQASSLLNQVLAADPENFDALYWLSTLARKDLNLKAAVDFARRAVAQRPNEVHAHLNLGFNLRELGSTDEAIETFQNAVALAPALSEANYALVDLLIQEERSTEAEPILRRMLEVDPQDSRAHSLLGVRLEALGQIEEARNSFKRSIQAGSKQGFAYYSLARSQRVTPSDGPLVSRMHQLLTTGGIPPKGVAYLHYGLGKAYEDVGEYEKAMAHYEEANAVSYRLSQVARTFNRKSYSATIDWTIKTFNRSFFDRVKSVSLDSDVPVFILGMMRSGSTLVEQILSSHPEIAGGGENRFWKTHGREALDSCSGGDAARKLSGLADEYLTSIRATHPLEKRITDKMPGNYALLGVIHALLPKARIIHTRRSPVDTCLSMYAEGASLRLGFGNNKSNLVFAYGEYSRLMEHWRRVLPSEVFLGVDYEHLIADRATVSRQMISFLGLEWDEACLSPEKNNRVVETPSALQVRQPVYSTSVERWRKFEPWLGEFKTLLPQASPPNSS